MYFVAADNFRFSLFDSRLPEFFFVRVCDFISIFFTFGEKKIDPLGAALRAVGMGLLLTDQMTDRKQPAPLGEHVDTHTHADEITHRRHAPPRPQNASCPNAMPRAPHAPDALEHTRT